MKSESNKPQKLLFLANKTPIQAYISDHNVLINRNILFFNMMMRGLWNSEKSRYNNGFGLKETIANYQDRIKNVVRVLAETTSLNPQIDIIGLAEAPIKAEDIDIFINEFKKYPSLNRFQDTVFSKMFTSMGVATFFDSGRYTIAQIQQDSKELQPSLQNRIHEFILESKLDHKKVRLFNLHLPYDIAKSKDNAGLIHFGRKLFEAHHQMPVVVIGDFNINPNIIASSLKNVAVQVQKNNNLLIEADQDGALTGYKLDTVDGVIRSESLDDAGFQHFLDADDLPWQGVSPVKEFQIMQQLLTSRYGFFNNVICQITHDNKRDIELKPSHSNEMR